MVPCVQTTRGQSKEGQGPRAVGGLGNCMEELRRELVLGDGDEGRFAERREDTSGRRITT